MSYEIGHLLLAFAGDGVPVFGIVKEKPSDGSFVVSWDDGIEGRYNISTIQFFDKQKIYGCNLDGF